MLIHWSLSDIGKLQGCESDCMDTYFKKAARNKQRAWNKQLEEVRKECHVTNQKVNLSRESLKHEQAGTLCDLREIIETCRLKNEEKVVTIG